MTETIGLDIGSHSIKLVGLKMTSKGPFLTCMGAKEIPPGKDKEGVNTVSEILKALVKEVGLKTKKVRLTVSGSGVHIKRISVPALPKAELKEAVRWEIKNYLPFPVETAEIDFHILNEYEEDNVKKFDLITVACPKDLVDRTLSIAQAVGLEPTHLDVAPFALWNASLTWASIRKEETVALIDLGAEKTGLYLFKEGILQFSREFTPAGTDMTRAIMEGMGSAGEAGLLYDRAERIKQEMGIPSEASQERISDPSTSLSKISFLVRPVLEKLVAEIGRSLDYYRSQFSEEQIDRVLLTGGGANLKNIVSFLGRELRLSVEHFNPLRKTIFDSKRIDNQLIQQMGSSFTIAAGIALPELSRIELLPAKKPFLTKAQIGRLTPVLAPVITLLVFLAIIWYMNGQAKAIQKERDVKMAKVANLEGLQTKLKLLKERDIEIKEKLSQLPSSVIVPVPYRDILKEFNGILPGNVTLTLLSVQSKGKVLKKGTPPSRPQEGESKKDEGRDLYFTGLAFGSDVNCLTAFAHIIERLERSPLFKNARLVSAEENKLYTLPGTGFEIACDINLDNSPSPPTGRGDFSRPDTGEAKASTTPKGGLGGLRKEKR
jgi:type IV pilus assembly protein PilM